MSPTRLAVRALPSALLAILVAGLTLLVAHKLLSNQPIFITWFEPTVNGVAFGALATVILRRRQESPMGWLFASLALLAAVQLLTGEYAVFAREVHPLPAASAVALLPALLTAFILPLVVLVLLLYPEGRSLSPRWRPLVWVVAACAVAEAAAAAVRPGGYDDLPGYTNPIGVSSLQAAVAVTDRWAARIEVVTLAIAVLGPVVRFRREERLVRQQLKWFALAVGSFVTVTTVIVAAGSRLPKWAPHVGFGLGVAGFAAATGVAILRHRLYEIDRVISRTLAYAVLTGLLIVIYVLPVTVATQLVPSNDSLVVAAATLAVAALFQPLRRRTQVVVDRRFNRSRYDAERTVDAFSARLREEVDLDSVQAHLLTVVQATMQPASTGVWLRGSTGVRG